MVPLDSDSALPDGGEATADAAVELARGRWREPERSDAPIAGRVLGEFRVLERIGHGGFGDVYLAQQASLNREAVIKVARHRNSSAAEREAFLREARLASLLDHPYAAHIYAFGVEPDGVAWIAMERVRGTTLAEILEVSGAISLAQWVPVFSRLCEVVAQAHAQGIVHCDIKPSNIMVISRAGQRLPKLLDLGIARAWTQEAAAEATLDEPAKKIRSAGSRPMGSPAYMAPEQWVGDNIDHRTDIYALALVAYEALTGHAAFSARSARELAQAHAKKPIPGLPGQFPVALTQVLRTAAAKHGHERYVSAAAFNEAFRIAAGFPEEGASLPRLPHALRERVCNYAPTPIALACQHIESARSIASSRDAHFQLLHNIAHWLGLVALARAGRKKNEVFSGTVSEILLALRKRPATTQDWLDIAAALHTEATPFELPEFQEYVASAHFESLRSLIKWQNDVRWRDHAYLSAELPNLHRQVSTLLQTAEFLTQYRVAALGSLGALAFNGMHVAPLAGALPAQEAAPRDAVILLDGDGVLATIASPLATAVRPAPESQFELFLWAGADDKGHALQVSGRGYSRSEESIWQWLRPLLPAEAGERAGVEEIAPFPGLQGFKAAQAAFYFGREREVDAFVNRLQDHPLLGITGSSGSGKSSFLRAGVVPALQQRSTVWAHRERNLAWTQVFLRPGLRPLAGLAAGLRYLSETLDLSEQRWRETPALAAEEVRQWALRSGHRLLVVVDQFEELFTQGSSSTEQLAYAQALLELARDAADPVRVVVSLRDDYLAQAEGLPPLTGVLSRCIQVLTTPNREALLRIVRGPAREVDYRWEPADTPEKMVAEVEGQKGALALLAFACEQAWAQRDRHFRVLGTSEAGSVASQLAVHAEAMLVAFTAEQQRVVRDVFRQLVTADGTRAIAGRDDLAEMFGDASAVVLDRLIAERLVVSSDHEDGKAYLEIIHEALIDAWPRLVTWRREYSEGARFRDQLRAAARQWDSRARARGLLWRGDALAEARQWQKRDASAADLLSAAFLAASEREARRAIRIKRALVVGVCAVLSVTIAIVLFAQRRSDAARAQAESAHAVAEAAKDDVQDQLAAAFVSRGRDALLAGDDVRAMALLGQARALGYSKQSLDFMLARAKEAVAALRDTLHVGEPIGALALSPTGDRVVMVDRSGRVRVVSTANRAVFAETINHDVFKLSWAGDERVILAGGTGVTLWTPATGETRSVQGAIYDVAVSPRGLVAVVGGDGVKVLSAVDLSLIWQAPEQAHAATWDGDILATAWGPALTVWSTSGRAVRQMQGPGSGALYPLVFRSSDELLAGQNTQLLSFRLGGPSRVADQLGSHEQFIVGITAAAGQVVACDRAGKIRVYRSGQPALRLPGHEGAVQMCFSLADQRVVSAGADGDIRVWDEKNGASVQRIAAHLSEITGLAIADAQGTLISGGSDGFARKWQIAARQPSARALAAADGVIVRSTANEVLIETAKASWSYGLAGVVDAALSPNAYYAVARGEAQASVFDIRSRTARNVEVPGNTRALAVDDHGRYLLVTTTEGAYLQSLADNIISAQFEAALNPRALPQWLGDHFAVVTRDILRIIHAASGREVAQFPGIDAFALAQNREALALATIDRSLFIVEAQTWQNRPIGKVDANVIDMAFSADGDRIAIATELNSVAVFDVRAPNKPILLTGHRDYVSRVAFGPYANLLASASADGTVAIWDLEQATRIYAYDYVTPLSLERMRSLRWIGDRLHVSAEHDMTFAAALLPADSNAIRTWTCDFGVSLQADHMVQGCVGDGDRR